MFVYYDCDVWRCVALLMVMRVCVCGGQRIRPRSSRCWSGWERQLRPWLSCSKNRSPVGEAVLLRVEVLFVVDFGVVRSVCRAESHSVVGRGCARWVANGVEFVDSLGSETQHSWGLTCTDTQSAEPGQRQLFRTTSLLGVPSCSVVWNSRLHVEVSPIVDTEKSDHTKLQLTSMCCAENYLFETVLLLKRRAVTRPRRPRRCTICFAATAARRNRVWDHNVKWATTASIAAAAPHAHLPVFTSRQQELLGPRSTTDYL